MASPALRKILLVEDDSDILAVAKLALEMTGGYAVETCSSGTEALEAAPTLQPDLIMLDVMMPGMDGPTTLGKLRELPACQHTPVVFLTAKVQPNEIEHYRMLGALDVIPKPFDPMNLSDDIQLIWHAHYE